jgi:hypothetical protein
LRRQRDRALREAYEAGVGTSVVGHQLDVFLFEPQSDRYLGRLCSVAALRVSGCSRTLAASQK